MSEPLLSILSVIISILVVNVFYEFISGIFIKSKRAEQNKPTPSERLQSLVNNLSKASKEADVLTQEIISDLRKRELALAELQLRNETLVVQENKLKKKIDTLKNVPIEVAEYFQKMNQQHLDLMDKKSGRRDVFFFILGSIASAIISILLRYFGLA